MGVRVSEWGREGPRTFLAKALLMASGRAPRASEKSERKAAAIWAENGSLSCNAPAPQINIASIGISVTSLCTADD